MSEFLKKAFKDMKESAKAQHEVDKANFVAAKAEKQGPVGRGQGHGQARNPAGHFAGPAG